MLELPKISIVTPSYNQGNFLEQTIKSVIEQNYSNLEYIIIDGGSTDNSVDIIEKYDDQITYWESKPDKGQADAIYRGFEHASGDIISWINSDDYYLDGALKTLGGYFSKNPLIEWIAGNAIIVNETNHDQLKCYNTPITFDRLYYQDALFFQPSVFYTRKAFFESGGFERDLRFCMDYDLFLNLSLRSNPLLIPEFLSAFRYHPHSKTNMIHDVAIIERNYIHSKKYRYYKRSLLYEKYRHCKKFFGVGYHRMRTSGFVPYLNWIRSDNSLIRRLIFHG